MRWLRWFYRSLAAVLREHVNKLSILMRFDSAAPNNVPLKWARSGKKISDTKLFFHVPLIARFPSSVYRSTRWPCSMIYIILINYDSLFETETHPSRCRCVINRIGYHGIINAVMDVNIASFKAGAGPLSSYGKKRRWWLLVDSVYR